MKIKTIIVALLVFQFAVHAQESKKKKPSWSDAMPERKDNPDIKVGIEKEEDFGLDRSSLGFDRDEFSSPEENAQDSTSQQITNKIEIQKQLDNERKKNAAQLAKLKKLEAERLASEKLAAKKREAERLAAEKEREAQRLARIQQEEQKRLAAQKREAERLAAEKLAAKERESQRLARIQQEDQEQIAAQQREQQKQLQEQIAEQKRAKQNNLENKATATTPIAKQEPQKKQVPTAPYKWKKIKNVAPVYPPRAARKKTEGWVEVEITIDSMGKVTDARVLRTKKNSHVFNNSALKAVKQWSYEPPINFGIKTELKKTVRLVYKL